MLRPCCVFAVLLVFGGALAGCDNIERFSGEPGQEAATDLPYQSVPVVRRDIVVAVEAAGVVEPVTTVEVKSKASGEILDLAVDTGDEVEAGTLLARIDQRVLKNALQTARASLDVARARFANAESQRERVNALYDNSSVSKSDWEQATLEYATAKSEVVRGEIQVENAEIQLGDSDVTAPITGTVIDRTVEQGQVISSPMGDVGGGTLLLKMADLSRVQVRMLVDEIDIGKVAPGVVATVSVAAFANRPFQGEVTKVEPQAVTQQNVTMFPVLIHIDNRASLLKPGMNADVEVRVADRRQVLAIPNAALRTQGDVYSAGSVLGYTMDDVQEMLDASPQPAAPGGEGARAPEPADEMSGEDAQMMAKIRAKFQSGERPNAEEIAFMRKMRARAGGGPGGGFARGGPGGGRAGGGFARGGSGGANTGRRASSVDGQFGGNYIVFAVRNGSPVAVKVRTGITDMDYSEVVGGLDEDDEVLILPSASLVNAQEAFQQRVSGRMGIPGLNSRK